MAVDGIEHVNIRTGHVAETIAFFRDLLGMEVRHVPGASDFHLGGWVYGQDGTAVVHIGSSGRVYPGEERAPDAIPPGGGSIHHVALRCNDYDGMRRRLETSGLEATFNDVPAFSLKQIFVRDPNQVLVELNFHQD